MKSGGKGKYRKQKKRQPTLSKPQKREVKKLIHGQVEDKYIESVYPYTAQSYSSGLVVPNQLTSTFIQEVGQGQRIGDRVTLRSVHIRMSIYHNTTTTTDPQNNYRVIVFKWKLSTQVLTPTAANVLQYTAGLASLNYAVDSPYNWKKQQDDAFAILYDKSFSISPQSPAVCHNIRLTKYLGNLNFEPGGSFLASGHIYLMVLCDDASTVGSCPYIGYIARTIYEDA